MLDMLINMHDVFDGRYILPSFKLSDMPFERQHVVELAYNV